MDREYGTVIGLVTDVDDPEGLGRVRLSFPWLGDATDSNWARIVRPMAGADRGFYFMPEKSDEVFVAFEHGDLRRPYVLGALYSRSDEPPDDDIDVHVRRIKTTSGHILDFDDRSGQERIQVKTQGGHSLLMDDAQGRITLATSGGTKLELNDIPGSVVISTPTGTSIEINPAGNVSVSGALVLDVSCITANINATAGCTITAPTVTVSSPIAMFSGVVQCSALITQSVVSASYTPGVGNIW